MIDNYIEANPYNNKKQFLEEALNKSISLPIEIRLKLEKFKRNGNNEGYILLENLPIDIDLIPTPIEHSDVAKTKKTFTSESNLAIIGSCLGSLYGYKQESQGSYFNNIRPTKRNKNIQSSESSEVFLELHTEIAFHNIIPDFILIHCLREDREKQAKTGVACIRNAIKNLDEESIKILMRKSFEIGIDYSFTGVEANGKTHKK